MAVMDEFREEREAIKTAPFKKKVEYFFDYYKWHTIIAIVVIASIISIVHEYTSALDTGLYAVYINTYTEDEDEALVLEEINALLEIDTSIEEVIIDTTYFLDFETQDYDHYTFIQKLVTVVATNTIDTCVGDEDTMVNLAYLGMCMDLEEFLTEEELEAYEGSILYIDNAIIEYIDSLDTADTDLYPDYAYSYNPEDMEDPVAVGVLASDDSMVNERFTVSGDHTIVAVVSTTARLEDAVTYFKYMLEGE